MSDLLEHDLREALADQAALLTARGQCPAAGDRLPPPLALAALRGPALGAVGLSARRRCRRRSDPARIERRARIRRMDREPHCTGARPARRCSTALRHGCRHAGSDRRPRPVHRVDLCQRLHLRAGQQHHDQLEQRWRWEIQRSGRNDRAQRGWRIRLRWARADYGRRPDRCRRDGRDHHPQRPNRSPSDRQERLVPGLVARYRARCLRAGSEREPHQHAILPERAGPPEPGLPDGRALQERLRLRVRSLTWRAPVDGGDRRQQHKRQAVTPQHWWWPASPPPAARLAGAHTGALRVCGGGWSANRTYVSLF